MAVLLSPVGGVAAQFFTNAGVPLSGGKIYTYAAGTSTPQATYTTGAGNIQHSNPIILDAAGRVPTGEIWLVDGESYKFVLQDANSVLVGTYDNIVGINSNFVNYVNQQEIQTATAGQTVFTLTTMTYNPGTNSLSVFVDGVNQYGPGAQYAYVETGTATVTFEQGLHVGALVKFTSTQVQNANVTDAAQISYTYPATNAIAESVQNRLAQSVSVKDFGAFGDGVADDTQAIKNAFAAARSVYFPTGTYLISGTILLNDNSVAYGNGPRNTIIVQTANLPIFQATNATVAARNQNITIKGMQLNGYTAMTATLVDMRNASYLTIDDVYIYGDPNLVASSNSIIIDNTLNGGSFNGYITLRNVYCFYGQMGYKGSANQLSIYGGAFNWNKTWGISVANSTDVQIIGCEVTSNAYGEVATYTGTYPSGKYDKGGINIDASEGIFITGVWFEYNANRLSNLAAPNDVQITSTCTKALFQNSRNNYATGIVNHALGLDAGQTVANGFGDQEHATYGLIANGKMTTVDSSNVPLGWQVGGTTTVVAASTFPSGVSGARITTANGYLTTPVLTAAQCAVLVGKTITVSCWVNAVTSPWPSDFGRIGFTNSSFTYFEALNASASAGNPMFVSLQYQITGTESTGIFFTAYCLATGGASLEIGNVACNLGQIAWNDYEKAVTSAGGDVWTQEFRIGGRRHGFSDAMPTTGTWQRGDIVYNTNPTLTTSPGYWLRITTGSGNVLNTDWVAK